MLVVAVLMVMLVALFGVAMVQLVEPFARHVLDVGPGVYGLLTGGYGSGAIVGSLLTVWLGDTFRRSHVAAVGLLGMAVGRPRARSRAGLGRGLRRAVRDGRGTGVLHGVVQHRDPAERRRGLPRTRASSLFTMSFFAAAPIGALVGGFVGEWAGLRVTMVGSAISLAALTVWALVRYRGLRPLDEAPAFDTVVTPVPRPTDLDTAGHLVVEPVD